MFYPKLQPMRTIHNYTEKGTNIKLIIIFFFSNLTFQSNIKQSNVLPKKQIPIWSRHKERKNVHTSIKFKLINIVFRNWPKYYYSLAGTMKKTWFSCTFTLKHIYLNNKWTKIILKFEMELNFYFIKRYLLLNQLSWRRLFYPQRRWLTIKISISSTFCRFVGEN